MAPVTPAAPVLTPLTPYQRGFINAAPEARVSDTQASDPQAPDAQTPEAWKSIDRKDALPSTGQSASSGDQSGGSGLAEMTLSGQSVPGTYGANGDFLSQDGTTYVPAGGSPEFGVTDPSTGMFLPGGSVRVIDGRQVYGTVDPSSGAFLTEDQSTLQLPDGFVEHGKVQASGDFLAELTVDGQQLWGSFDDKGNFLSEDGTTFVPAGEAAQHGITDPNTGNFLPGGQVRVIDGQTVYGTVDPATGSFLSEDQTLLQLPGGFVEHGKVLPNGDFIAVITVGGAQVWGSFDDKGNFLSQDGTTYVPAGGPPEYGVTTPGPDGEFLPGGSTYTLPSGQVLYGYAEDGGFVTADGNTLVLSDGTVVQGSLDQSDGIFTGNNGQDFFLGTTGISRAYPQPDGSYNVPGVGVIMTPQSWRVDLGEFWGSIMLMDPFMNSIADECTTITNEMGLAASYWDGPAGNSFSEIIPTVNKALQETVSMLASMRRAMVATYANYVSAENGNAQNFGAATALPDSFLPGDAAGSSSISSLADSLGAALGRGAAAVPSPIPANYNTAWIAVDGGGLNKATNNIQTAATEISDNLMFISDVLQSLYLSWDGSASKTAAALQSQWENVTQLLFGTDVPSSVSVPPGDWALSGQGALPTLVQALQQAVSNYDQNEAAVASMFNSFASGFDPAAQAAQVLALGSDLGQALASGNQAQAAADALALGGGPKPATDEPSESIDGGRQYLFHTTAVNETY